MLPPILYGAGLPARTDGLQQKAQLIQNCVEYVRRSKMQLFEDEQEGLVECIRGSISMEFKRLLGGELGLDNIVQGGCATSVNAIHRRPSASLSRLVSMREPTSLPSSDPLACLLRG